MITNNIFAKTVKVNELVVGGENFRDLFDSKVSIDYINNLSNSVVDVEIAAEKLEQYGTSDITITTNTAFGFSNGIIISYDFDLGGADVVIPYEINGIPVTTIGNLTFSDVDTWIGDPITSVIAPKSVTSIGTYAFAGCGSLTSVSLPSVTSIGGNAFANCGNLTSVSFPSVTSIGDYAFAGCGSLTSVSLPLVTSISNSAFNSCVNLTSVYFPSVTSIGNYAFDGCVNLTSVYLGDVVPTDNTSSISETSATIYVSETATGYGDTFSTRPVVRPSYGLKDVTIYGELDMNDKVQTNLNTKTYYSDGSRVTVVDGEITTDIVGVRGINKTMYGDPDVVPDVTTKYTYTTSGGEVTITGSTGTYTSFVVPYEIDGNPVTEISTLAFRGKATMATMTSVVLPNSINEIGAEAFSLCSELVSVRLPEGLQVLPNSLFDGCFKLQYADIPDSVKSIGDSAFDHCYPLQDVVIPNGVTNLGTQAFQFCKTNMREIVIPESVKTIGNNCFAYCSVLNSVTFEGDAPVVGSNLYLNSSIVTNYVGETLDGYGSTLGGRIVVRPKNHLDGLTVNGFDVMDALGNKSDALYGSRMTTGTNIVLISSARYYDVQATNENNYIGFDFSNVDLTNNVANWITYIHVKSPTFNVFLPDGVEYMEDYDMNTTLTNEIVFVSWSAWADVNDGVVTTNIQASQYGRK